MILSLAAIVALLPIVASSFQREGLNDNNIHLEYLPPSWRKDELRELIRRLSHALRNHFDSLTFIDLRKITMQSANCQTPANNELIARRIVSFVEAATLHGIEIKDSVYGILEALMLRSKVGPLFGLLTKSNSIDVKVAVMC